MMRNRSTYTIIILLLLLPMLLPSAAVAQHSTRDAINPYRVVQRSTLHGISLLNTLDTYLSGYDHKGAGYHIQHETLRRAHTGSYNWIFRTRTDATLGIATQHSNSQLLLMASRRWSGYHPFTIGGNLKILAGAQIRAEGGALYTPAYSNNPVSAKAGVTMDASAMAVYTFLIGEKEYRARYTMDIPLIGALFAPEYGQSYYEIFGLGHTRGIIHISSPFNAPSMTHSFVIDIPTRKSTLRIAYIADIYQSDINSLRTHIYTHSFLVGYSRTIYKVKRNDPIEAYSPL
ncbi:MAG: DUF3316 domain-containing protein [Bacteroidaceae bacterium]|nr:DUF3316 domain-containing protein [Bacteroidaceae bacterium]